MSFKTRSPFWFSIKMLTVVIACVVVTGCEQESQEARPPKNLNMPLEKAPDMARDRANGGGNSQPTGGEISQNSGGGGSRQSSGGGGGVANPPSPLRKAPGTARPQVSGQGARSGGGLTKKGS